MVGVPPVLCSLTHPPPFCIPHALGIANLVGVGARTDAQASFRGLRSALASVDLEYRALVEEALGAWETHHAEYRAIVTGPPACRGCRCCLLFCRGCRCCLLACRDCRCCLLACRGCRCCLLACRGWRRCLFRRLVLSGCVVVDFPRSAPFFFPLLSRTRKLHRRSGPFVRLARAEKRGPAFASSERTHPIATSLRPPPGRRGGPSGPLGGRAEGGQQAAAAGGERRGCPGQGAGAARGRSFRRRRLQRCRYVVAARQARGDWVSVLR